MKKHLTISAICAALVSTSAFAQTAPAAAPRPTTPAAPAAAPAVPSPVIIVNVAYVVQASAAGQDMANKINTITQAMAGELQPEARAIDAERNRLAQTPASQLQTPQFQAQEEALGKRLQAFEAKRQKTAADLQATRQAAFEALQAALDPVLRGLLTSRNAYIILDSSSAVDFVGGVDATAELLTKFNGAVRTINVVRVNSAANAANPAPSTPAAPATNAPLPRAPTPAPAPRPR